MGSTHCVLQCGVVCGGLCYGGVGNSKLCLALSLFTVDAVVVVGFFFALSFVLSVFSFCARFLDGPRRVSKYAAAAVCLCVEFSVCVCVSVFCLLAALSPMKIWGI